MGVVKKKNVPKQYRLDATCDDVEPYSPRSIVPVTTRAENDEELAAPIYNDGTFESSTSDSMDPGFGPPAVHALTSVAKEQITTFVSMPNCDFDETTGKYSVSFENEVIPVTTMEGVSLPGMEGLNRYFDVAHGCK